MVINIKWLGSSKDPLKKAHTTRDLSTYLNLLVFLLFLFQFTTRIGATSFIFTSEPDTEKTKVARGDTIHAVWEEDRDKNCECEIYYHRSTDKGKTWKLEKCLSYISPHPKNPSIRVSKTTVSVLWLSTQDNGDAMYYRRSTDAGTTWEPSVRLASVVAAGRRSRTVPRFGVSDPLLVAVWKDDRDGYRKAIYVKRSTDSGANWGPDTRLALSPDWLLDPDIDISGSTVHLTWRDIRDGNWEIYYKRSTDGGLTWNSDTRLTSDLDLSISPRITSDGPTVRIIWEDRRGNEWGRYSKRSTDGGSTWGPDSLVRPGRRGFTL